MLLSRLSSNFVKIVHLGFYLNTVLFSLNICLNSILFNSVFSNINTGPTLTRREREERHQKVEKKEGKADDHDKLH